MDAVMRVTSIVQPCVVSLWKRRRTLLFAATVASLAITFIFLLAFWQHLLVACQFFYDSVLPQSLKILIRLLTPSYLYIILNLVIMTIVATSGVLNQEKHADLWMESRLMQEYVEKNHLIKPAVSSTSECDIEKPAETSSLTSLRMEDLPECDIEISETITSNPVFLDTSLSKEDLPVCHIERSEPILSNPVNGKYKEAGLQFQSCLLTPGSITIQENAIHTAYGDKTTASHHIVVDKPIFTVDVQLVHIDKREISYSNIQSLLIDEVEGACEFNTDEINERAEAFIVHFHNQLKQERQESILRYRESGEWA